MPKKWIAACAGIVLLAGQPAWAFKSSLVELAYVELPSPKLLESQAHEIEIQHHFNNWNIESMNFRFGYGVTDELEIDAAAIYHSTEIDFGAPSQIGIHEYQLMPRYQFLSENKAHFLDLSVMVGVNEMFVYTTYQDHKTMDQETRVGGGLVAGKTLFTWLAVQASPLAVYDHKDGKTVEGLGLGAKFMLDDAVALIGEYPVLFNDPYHNPKNPWSVGVQFHLGPHMLTLFVSDTYGLTLPYLLQGLDQTYYGFRWSF